MFEPLATGRSGGKGLLGDVGDEELEYTVTMLAVSLA
jgi:hypothetical protein